MHPHTQRFGVGVSGIRKEAPCGPSAKDDPVRHVPGMDVLVGEKFMPIGGGAPKDGGQKKKAPKAEVPPEPDDMSDEDLSTEETRLTEELQAEYDGERDIDKMRDLRDRITALRTEQDSRAEDAQKRDEEAEAIMSEVVIKDEQEGDDEEENDNEDTDEDTDENDGEQQEAKDEAGNEGSSEGEPAKIAAEVENAEPEKAPASKPRPRARVAAAMPTPPEKNKPKPKTQRSHAAVTAAANFPGAPAGSELTLKQTGQLFADQAHALMTRKTVGVPVPIARFSVEFPEERQLGSDVILNRERINAVVSEEAITAAGGSCAPLEVMRYTFENVSSAARPLFDSLQKFNAPRGGVRWLPSTSINNTTYDAGIAIITEADDAAGYPPTDDKPCLVIDCPDEEEVKVQAQTQCVQAGNFSRRFFPELFADFWTKSTAVFARTAETEIWNAMCAASNSLTIDKQLGAFRDTAATIRRLVAGFRSRHRTDDAFPLHVWAPRFLGTMAGIDLLRQHPGDDTYNVGVSELVSAVNVDSNVTFTWVMDPQYLAFAGESSEDGDLWPSTVDFIIAHEGAFIGIDEGTLDFGMEIRDSTLNKKNNVQAMYETFEAVAMVGIEPLCVTSTICPDGSYSSVTAAPDCTDLPS